MWSRCSGRCGSAALGGAVMDRFRLHRAFVFLLIGLIVVLVAAGAFLGWGNDPCAEAHSVGATCVVVVDPDGSPR